MSTAWEATSTASRAAGVEVRDLTAIDELQALIEVLTEIWGRPENPPMTSELLRALGKADNYVAGAYDGDRLVGGCVGFHSSPDQRILHSHIAGVTSGMAGRHVGFALKLHQRAWALDRGIEVVEWTYDPLIARNAYFNLAKLGARPTEYLANFYGAMDDAINGDDETDRILVRWALSDPSVVAACAGSPRVAVPPPGAVASWVAVPAAVEALRGSDPAEARAWRAKVREQLAPTLAAGGRIEGFDRQRGYLVLPPEGELR